MTWLTWRQFRVSAATMAAVLAVVAGALVATGPDLASRYATGIAECTRDDTCDRFFDQFFDEYQVPFLAATFAVLLLPALIGIFWGTPLVTRELETGTHLLVWSQSITRSRWLATKLGITGLAAVTAAGLCGLAVTWWSDPLDKSAAPDFALMAPLVFGARGVVPVTYTAFAFVLGVTVGMLVRRTVPAMAVTLALFAAVQLAMPLLVRPHLMPPVTSTFALSEANVDHLGIPPQGGGPARISLKSAVPGHAGAWVLSTDLVDSSGRTVASGSDGGAVQVSTTSGPCAAHGGGQGPAACLAEINRLGYRQRVTYHPLDRFWPFQWIEAGAYAALTLGLTGLSFWWLRRRLS